MTAPSATMASDLRPMEAFIGVRENGSSTNTIGGFAVSYAALREPMAVLLSLIRLNLKPEQPTRTILLLPQTLPPKQYHPPPGPIFTLSR